MSDDNSSLMTLPGTSSVQLPPFDSKDPELWFCQAEAQFAIYNITDQTAKFNYVVLALPTQVTSLVRNVIVQRPPREPYERLKKAVLDLLNGAAAASAHSATHDFDTLSVTNPAGIVMVEQKYFPATATTSAGGTTEIHYDGDYLKAGSNTGSSAADAKTFECRICRICFTGELALVQHMQSAHVTQNGLLQCGRCNNFFQDQSHLEDHVRTVHGNHVVHVQTAAHHASAAVAASAAAAGGHECPLCHAKFTQKYNVVRHIRSVHESQITFNCDRCSAKFRRKDHLKKHVDAVHEKLPRAARKKSSKRGASSMSLAGSLGSSAASSGAGVVVTGAGGTVQVTNAAAAVSQAAALHAAHHPQAVPLVAAASMASMATMAPMVSVATVQAGGGPAVAVKSEMKFFECRLCHVLIAGNVQLLQHMQFVHHMYSGPFPCTVCSDSFDSQALLDAHVKKVHENPSRFVCHICNNRFRRKDHLERHIKDVHDNLFPYVCELCTAKFKRSDKLKHHRMVVHEKLKPFHCDRCNGDFSTGVHLRRHIKRVHEKNNHLAAPMVH